MRKRANDTCVEQYSQRINCAQVKGAVKTMVTVVTTQELEAGHVLRRFREETAQDYPRRGNNNNRYIVVGLAAVGVCDAVHLCVVLFFSFFIGTRMCDDDDLYCFSCDVWYFVQGNTTCFAGSWLSEMEMCTILRRLDTPPISAPTPQSHHRAKNTTAQKNAFLTLLCQRSRRSPRMSSTALSMTALAFLQKTIAPRCCTARLANGMCRM